jgi:hypothetical protein
VLLHRNATVYRKPWGRGMRPIVCRRATRTAAVRCSGPVLVRVDRTRGSAKPEISAPRRRGSGPDWVHEIKHDGYHLQVRRDRDAVRLLTRPRLRSVAPRPTSDLTFGDLVASVQN